MYPGIICVNKLLEKPKCPSAKERLNSLQYIHAMEYYAAVKKDQIFVSEFGQDIRGCPVYSMTGSGWAHSLIRASEAVGIFLGTLGIFILH